MAPQSDLDFLNSLSLNPTSDNTSTASPNPSSAAATTTSDPTLTSLQSISSTLSITDPDSLSEQDILNLLEQIDKADSAADGLESRLDNLLGTLDGMLGALGEDGEPELSKVEEEDETVEEKVNGKKDDTEPEEETKP